MNAFLSALTYPARRFYSVKYMVNPTVLKGDLPPNREAYDNLVRIAIPSVAEMVLMSLIGAVDTMMVGTLGPEAIAAVGLTGQPRMLLLALFFALNIGVTAVVARRKGEGNQLEANRTLRNAMVISFGIGFVFMVVGVLGSYPLMQLAGAQADTIDMAYMYFTILAFALPLNALTMCINAAQRGIGNTRMTMYVNVTSNIVNVIFNYLLIGGNFGFPRLGVTGAAIATLIGFGVGFVLSIFSVASKRIIGFLHVSWHDDWRINKLACAAMTKVGGNAMLEQLALRIGFFVYARIVADLGTQAFAAHQICMQFLSITFTFGDGLGIAGTSLVGQMLGKERPDLSMMYGKISQRLALTVSVFLALLVVAFRYPLVELFTQDQQVIALAAQVMLLVALFQPFQTSSVVISGCLRGAGDTRYVAVVMLLCVAVIRPTLSIIMVYGVGAGLVGAWASSLTDMIIRLISVYRRFSSSKWTKIKV